MYSGNQVVIMDDNLKGLDSDTASKCFNAIFGAQGLLRDQNRAVLFATHNGMSTPPSPPRTKPVLTEPSSAQWLRFADQIIALGSDGTISERGSYEELSKTGGYVSTLKVSQQADHADDAGAAGEEPRENGQQNGKPAAAAKPKDAAGSKARGAANTSSLVYYIRSMGTSAFFLFVAMVLLQMACRTMQRKTPAATTCASGRWLTHRRRPLGEVLGGGQRERRRPEPGHVGGRVHPVGRVDRVVARHRDPVRSLFRSRGLSVHGTDMSSATSWLS